MKELLKLIFGWGSIITCFYIVRDFELKTIVTLCFMLLIVITYGIFHLSIQIKRDNNKIINNINRLEVNK